MKKTGIIFLLSMLLSAYLFSQEIYVKFEQEKIVGADENAADEYIFKCPENISIDKNGDIYLSDYTYCKINIYDRNFKFIRTIGNMGQGPGEFQQIDKMSLSENGMMIVWDKINSRFTLFDMNQKFMRTFKIARGLIKTVDPKYIGWIGKDKILIYNRESGLSSSPQEDEKLFHIIDIKQKKILESFGRAGEIWDFKNSFLRKTQVGFENLRLIIINSDSVLMVPEFYFGDLYLFHKERSIWRLNRIKGVNPGQKPYKIYGIWKPGDKRGKYIMTMNFESGQRYLYLPRHVTIGFFRLNNGYYVHLLFEPVKNTTCYGVQLFDPKLNYLGYCKIKDKTASEDVFIQEVLSVDYEDRIYALSLEKGFPCIRVLRLEYICDNK